MFSFYYLSTSDSEIVSGVSRAKIEEVTLNALRTRQSLVKGERLVRHEVRAVQAGTGKHINSSQETINDDLIHEMA